jgi:hypothetical protein
MNTSTTNEFEDALMFQDFGIAIQDTLTGTRKLKVQVTTFT